MALTGGISSIHGSPNSLEVHSLAEFAVHDHKTKENSMLGLAKVVTARQQVVSGTMYHITLVAKDGDKDKLYETKVWVQPWKNFKQVQEFKYVGDAPASADCTT